MVSIWHWLILLLFMAAIPIGIAFVAARSNKDLARKVGRLGLLKRLAILALANLAFGFLLGVIVDEETGNVLSFFVGGTISIAFMTYWSVDRLRDIGSTSIRPAYFVGVPLLGLAVILYLLIKKGVNVESSAPPEPEVRA